MGRPLHQGKDKLGHLRLGCFSQWLFDLGISCTAGLGLTCISILAYTMWPSLSRDKLSGVPCFWLLPGPKEVEGLGCVRKIRLP
jgi:hypothetical protein